ncbi:hypothetical protein ANSO36C_67800 (plasmid) [Nostoc cf. commune SO-36]|uniref:Uncharacterized protein n=1 Tax=Nostoc cf. commune SO-36 TaxID=449208 RepID=A0ABM7ZCF8_NOSCO|nr:hypothetical protein [Nostoc commune]BDI20978.1 hypothetical protein ANSO36C_67800 [Nostoc cf. commune SO-36]
MVNNDENDFLKELMEKSDRLDAEERAKLIKHLLGEPGLQVVIGSNQVHATNVYQVNLNSPDQISTILDAIARKISSDDSSEGKTEGAG